MQVDTAKISKKLHGTREAKVLCCRFSVYIKKITPLQNGDKKVALLTPFFLQNKLLPQKFEKLHGTTESKGFWVRFSIYFCFLPHSILGLNAPINTIFVLSAGWHSTRVIGGGSTQPGFILNPGSRVE